MIELHCKTSDWEKHKHETDKNYNSVVLHVVWEHDAEINSVPVLELKDRVSKIMLNHYTSLMSSASFIPCESSIITVPDIILKKWKERLVAERLEKKMERVNQFLESSNYHWEESFWWMLSRNFGIKVNEDAFEAMARSIPLNVLSKHKNQLQQVEALLFGQAGLLHNKLKDSYAKLLQKEYMFLRKKYNLRSIFQPVQFLRMRPGNFPTIRIAQLASLVNQSAHLFSRIKEAADLQELFRWFDVSANDYWHYRYRFDVPSPFMIKKLGRAMIDNLLINTVTPVLFAYGHYYNDDRYKQKSVLWLEQTAAEHNRITSGFELIGLENRSAWDSQAFIQLKKEYCDERNCLDCAVGNSILGSDRMF
jgi:hypothetical protein